MDTDGNDNTPEWGWCHAEKGCSEPAMPFCCGIPMEWEECGCDVWGGEGDSCEMCGGDGGYWVCTKRAKEE